MTFYGSVYSINTAVIIKIQKLNREAKLPNYAHPYDAGLDLFIIETKTLKSNERYGFATGLAFELPKGFVGLVWDKSGLSSKFGLHVLSGVLDSGYRGELIVIVHNLSKKSYKFEKGDKVAQLLIQPIVNVKIKEVDQLSNTSRGDKGFGSSGRK